MQLGMQALCTVSLQVRLLPPLVSLHSKNRIFIEGNNQACFLTKLVTTLKPTWTVTPREDQRSQNSTTVRAALQQQRRPLTQGPMKQTQNGVCSATGLCRHPTPTQIQRLASNRHAPYLATKRLLSLHKSRVYRNLTGNTQQGQTWKSAMLSTPSGVLLVQ
jgi:hypothetical protein